MQTILIVDDEPLIIQLWKRLLHPLDCKLVSASDGVEGLKILHAQKVDILVTDLCMPNLDGVGLMSALCTEPRFTQLTTFVCSGFSKDADLSGLPIERIIEKPFDVRKERAYFTKFLESRR